MKKVAVLAFSILLLFAIGAQADTVYSDYSTIPPNVASLGYQATQTAEFGDAITLASGGRLLTTVDVVMSNWAKESTYEAVGTSAGYSHPLTLNLYNYTADGSVGTLFATKTINAFIQWRPEADAACTDGRWMAADAVCYNGLAQEVSFDFTGMNVNLPDTFIYGLAYNTQSWGANPIGAPGPYNSLNFGLEGVDLVGSSVDPDTAYWNTKHAPYYTDGGAAGSGIFRADTLWTGYQGEVRFNAVPEPASLAMFGSGLLGFAALLRRKK